MGQQVALTIEGEKEPQKNFDPAVEVRIYEKGSLSGFPSIEINGVLVTGKNFLSLAAAFRGVCQKMGVITPPVDPQLAVAAQPKTGVVHFAFEGPMQSWTFTTAEAKKFWRVLRTAAETSQP